MKKKKPKGRPGIIGVPPELLKDIRAYFYPDSSFTEDDNANKLVTYSESRLKSVVRVITKKIQNYVLDPKDDDVLFLVKSKLREGDPTEEILKSRTLKRCLENKKASPSTINMLKAFSIIVKKEEQSLGKVAGLYHVFAIHHTHAGRFQESVVRISKDGQGMIRFMNRDYEVQESTLEMERFGNNNLLLTYKETNFPLIFYLYLGPDKQTNHPFYQATYIYSNGRGNTVANLAVFQRIDLEKEGYKNEENFLEGYVPKRRQEKLTEVEKDTVDSDPNLTVRKNIQYFLLQHTRPIATRLYEDVPFDFRKSVPSYPGSHSNPTSFYAETKKFEGDYYIYFNERFPSDKIEDRLLDKNDFFSSIGKGVLKIWADSVTGVLECEMRIKKDKVQVLIYQGVVLNDQLSNDDYLILSMYLQPKNERYTNLLFRVINDNKLIGGYNIAYSSPGQLGVGTVVMIKTREEDKQKKGWDIPATIPPSSYHTEDSLEQAIVNFLSRNRQAITVPVSYSKLKPHHQNFRYHGVYYMYSRRIKQGYRKSALVIALNRAVKLTTQEGHKAFGEVEQRGNALNITLRYEDEQGAGFCCIRVDSVTPRKKYSAYQGTFAGIYPAGEECPIASLFIVRFMGTSQEEKNEVEQTIEREKENPTIPPWVQKRLDEYPTIKPKDNLFGSPSDKSR